MKSAFLFCVFSLFVASVCFGGPVPLKLAVAGLSHGHVDWVFNRPDTVNIKLVGIYETDTVLVQRYAQRYNIDEKLFFANLEQMLEEVQADAVSVFCETSGHLSVVRACAPRKVHVMVEKPLATTYADAKEIRKLAEANNIHVLTNYETSWYSSNQMIKAMHEDGELGNLTKVLVNDGHQGPKEIGVSTEFFNILTDAHKNGAGALFDFGCYGANLMTWLMNGEKPLSVTAVTNQNKPDIYINVDDEASIILQYPKTQCIVQASWNWPFSRKDMEVYGTKGYAIAADATMVRVRLQPDRDERTVRLSPRNTPFDDPFSLLAAVVNGTQVLHETDLYGLEVNVVVVEILEAAVESARTGQTIELGPPAG